MLSTLLLFGKNIGKRLLFPPRRAPGPSFFDDKSNGLKSEAYWTLDYPLKLHQQFGQIVYMRFLKQHIITGAESFEHILKTHAKNYPKHMKSYKKRMYPIFGASILTAEGNYWKHRRKIATPVYQKNHYPDYVSWIANETQEWIKTWQKKPRKKLNILTEMNQLTLKIVLKLFSNQSISEKILKKLGNSIYFCNWYAARALFIHPWKPTFNNIRFYWHLKRMDTSLLEMIEARRKNPTSDPDLLNLLIEAKNEETERPFSNQEVLAEFKTHLLTGHETTASGLAWMWSLLAKNPTCRKKLETELKTVLNGRIPSFEDFDHLPYARAITLETFRLYPPIWAIARRSIEEDQILGYDIPKNAFMLMHIYALHRNPDYWEDPEEFRPERFLDGAPKVHPFAYLPFSMGNRICIAHQFSVVESVIITAILAQQFHFDLPKKAKPIVPEPCISLRPKGGIRVICTPRSEGGSAP